MYTKIKFFQSHKSLNMFLLFVLLFSSFSLGHLPAARAQPDPCNNGSNGSFQTGSLDGVDFQFCLPFSPDHSSSADREDWVQSGSWIKLTPHKEFSIYTIPYGVKPAADNLPTATEGVTASYQKSTLDFYGPDAVAIIEGPSILIFGNTIQGATYLLQDKNGN